MNRTDFMEQLDRLLQDIPSAEREEALQYYNDYFDDAGKENEQAVMKALGNPARVAENIKRDLTESGIQTQAKASDEAIVEYGKAYEEENRQEKETAGSNALAAEREGGSRRRRPLPGWAVLLILAGAIFLSPLGFGLLGVLFGVFVCWFALIFSFGIVALALFIMLITLIGVGIKSVFVDPLVGVAMIGGGLVCGGLGLLFLMVTVALAGIVTPALFRGIGRLFRHARK